MKATGLFSNLSAPRGAFRCTHSVQTLVTNFILQFKVVGISDPPLPVHYTGCPVGNYFGYPPVAQPGCSVSAGQQATTYLPVGAGLSYDSNLPYSPTA